MFYLDSMTQHTIWTLKSPRFCLKLPRIIIKIYYKNASQVLINTFYWTFFSILACYSVGYRQGTFNIINIVDFLYSVSVSINKLIFWY